MKKFLVIIALVLAPLAVMAEESAAPDFEVTLELLTAYNYFYFRDAGIEADGNELFTHERISGTYMEPALTVKKKLDDCTLNMLVKAVLEPGQAPVFTVYSAYVDINEGPFSMSVGKQRVKWGTGFMWNPSDVLQNAKYALTPDNDLEGTYSIKASLSNDTATPMVFVSSELAKSEDEMAKSISYGAQLYKLAGTADIFINAAYRKDYVQSIGAAFSWDVDLLVVNAEAAAIRYMKDAPNAKFRLHPAECGSIRPSFVAGLNKKLAESFFLSAEYYYNGWGINNTDYSDMAASASDISVLPDIMAVLGAFPKNHYLGLNASYTMLDTISLSAAAVYGADDGAIYWYPGIAWNPSDNYGFEVFMLYNGTDSGNSQGRMLNPARAAFEFNFNAYF